MKLVNNRYQQQIEFNKFSTYYLIIENSQEYLKVIEEMYNEIENNIESDFVLSDNNEIVSLSKNCLFLHNYLDLDVNNKKIINEINNQVIKVISSKDFVEDFCRLNEIFININDKIIENFDFKVEYDSELSCEKLTKLANFKIASHSKFAERLMSYIKIYVALKNIKIVIFVGLSQFLSKEELNIFLKELEYLELKCLLIEPHEKYKLGYVGRIVIDEDLCEI